MYHRINRELACAAEPAAATIELTVMGHGLQPTLRATGT
jgi:hypothetical protein